MTIYLNTPPIFSQKLSKVDREKGIINNIVVASIGEAKGHNLHLNSKFLDDIVLLATDHQTGIKARFGHPNICATALGTYLGRYKNYRRKGDEVLADLHLDDSAKKSPKGNLYDYVLDMAENNPDMFGASIAFKRGKDKIELSEVDGENIEKSFATIKALYATDLVDSPAATDGLFEVFHEDDLASQVTIFLDQHPQVFELLDKKPQILDEFVANYKHYKSLNTMNFSDEINKLKSWISDNFAAKQPKELSDYHQTIFNDLKQSFEDKLSAIEAINPDSNLTEKITLLEKEKSDLQTSLDSHVSTIEDHLNSIEGLNSEINQLKANPTIIGRKSDPAINLNQPKDQAGKELLNSMPQTERKKLK
jgi:hypothetical protein